MALTQVKLKDNMVLFSKMESEQDRHDQPCKMTAIWCWNRMRLMKVHIEGWQVVKRVFFVPPIQPRTQERLARMDSRAPSPLMRPLVNHRRQEIGESSWEHCVQPWCREKAVLDARVFRLPDLLFRAYAGLERGVCVRTRMEMEQMRKPFGKGSGLCMCDAWSIKGYH
jgi:hypothetical protein